MSTPIERLIDASLRCTRCGAGYGKCDCWEPVTLECPQCGRTKRVSRDMTDPLTAVRIVAHCNTCPGKDNGLIDYFDKDGKQVFLP